MAIAQVKTRMTVVRIAVARFESMPDTPTLANNAVAAAKTAERTAQKIQVIVEAYADGRSLDGLECSSVNNFYGEIIYGFIHLSFTGRCIYDVSCSGSAGCPNGFPNGSWSS